MYQKIWDIPVQGQLASRIIRQDDLLAVAIFGKLKARGGWAGWGNIYDFCLKVISSETGEQIWDYQDYSLDAMGVFLAPGPLGFYLAYPDTPSGSYHFIYFAKNGQVLEQWEMEDIHQVFLGPDCLFVETAEAMQLLSLPQRQVIWERKSWGTYYYPLCMTGPLVLAVDLKTGQRSAGLISRIDGSIAWQAGLQLALDSTALGLADEDCYYVVQPGNPGGIIVLDQHDGRQLHCQQAQLPGPLYDICWSTEHLQLIVGSQQLCRISRDLKQITFSESIICPAHQGPFLAADLLLYMQQKRLLAVRYEDQATASIVQVAEE